MRIAVQGHLRSLILALIERAKACVVFTQCHSVTDRQTDGTDILTMASTGLVQGLYRADAL